MQKILVTGGTGFIGGHLITELLADGWQVEVLTRSMDTADKRLPTAVRAITHLDQASEPDAIVNLAGENLSGKRWSAAQKQALVDSRQHITHDLVDFISRCKQPPKAMVSGSAVGYYGACGAQPVDEDWPPSDEFQSRLCANWEACAKQAEQFGVRVCLIRTGIVLDDQQGALTQMLTPFKLGLGGAFGDGRQYMSWIHIRDEVGAILFLLSASDCHGAYNLTAPQPVTNHEFGKTLGRVLHRPAIMRIPAMTLKLLLGEMSDLILTGQRVLPTRLEKAGYPFQFESLESALEDILNS